MVLFVPECSRPTATLSRCLRETNPHCSNISALDEEFIHEGTSYSSSRQKKLNPRKQFSQLELLKLHKGSPLKEHLFPAVPWHTSTAVCSLYCAFPQPSHSCMYRIGQCSCCSLNTHLKAAPPVVNKAIQKCSNGSHTTPGLGWLDGAQGTGLTGAAGHGTAAPHTHLPNFRYCQQAAGAQRPSPQGSRFLTVQSVPVSEPQPQVL